VTGLTAATAVDDILVSS